MRNIFLISFLILCIIGCKTTSVVSDIGIQKRKYRKGFFINNAINLQNTAKINSQTQQINTKITEKQNFNNDTISGHTEENLYVSVNKGNVLEKNVVRFKNNNTILVHEEKKSDEECDLIILKSGQEIKVKVLEIGTEDIKYKMCENINGPTFTKFKHDVFMIKYPNGCSTVISDNQSTSSNNYSSGNNSSKKDSTTAILLCLLILIGLGGIHRIYLGYIGIGILQLLTGGCCGIWQLIDLIRLLTGSLKPKDGEFKE